MSPWAATVLLAVSLSIGYTAEAVPRLGRFPAGSSAPGLPTFFAGDGRFYRAILLTMIQSRGLDLRATLGELGYDPLSNTALGVRGEWYPKHAILLPLVSAPFYLAAGDAGLLAFNIVQLTALGVLIWHGARRYTTDTMALAITWWFAFGTLLRPAAYNYSPDVLSTLLVFGAYLAVVSHRAVWSGLLLGLSIWAKIPNATFLAVAGLYCVVTWPRGDVARMAAAAAVPLALFGALNAHLFGSPLVTSYDRVIAGFTGGRAIIEASHRTFFDQPFWQGLWTQLFDTRLGLLVSAPMAILLVPGLSALYHRAPAEAWLTGGMIVSQIAFFAPYRLWNQSSFGHRFILTAIVLMSVPIAALATDLLDRPASA